ncbi:hypothetical protein AS27_09436, partial [Aptenodytes forsteri]
VYVKVPFSTADLKKWKDMAGSYREDPDEVARTVEIIIENHDPDWRDMQGTKNTLLTYEERRTVLAKAREENERLHKQHGSKRLKEFLPTDDPAWDPNDVIQRLLISGYQQLILFGIKNGIPKPKNLSKLYWVVQGEEETPSAFYE